MIRQRAPPTGSTMPGWLVVATRREVLNPGTPTCPTVRCAVVGTLVNGNPSAFHAPDGSGYAFFARALKKLDGINPQIADNSIHAVSIKTFTRAEWEKAQKMGLA